MVPRQGLSENEYARHRGLSRSSVKQAKACGRLVLFPDGSIDAKASDERWEQTRQRMDRVTGDGRRGPQIRLSLADIQRLYGD